jgi:DNA adenine methylase
MADLMSVAAAIALIDDLPVSPRKAELPLDEAAGMRLAQDLRADRDYPPFDKSLMDGYAVRAADLPAQLRVIGESAAGSWPQRGLGPGEAMAVMTGAPLPPGADAVVPIEQTDAPAAFADAGHTVGITQAIKPRDNVATRGHEMRRGDLVLAAGTLMQAPQIAVAACVGAAKLSVWDRPRCAVLATGNELISVQQSPQPAQLRNSNNPMLRALLNKLGYAVGDLGVAPDEAEKLSAAIQAGLRHDALFITGGMSKGRYDHVPRLLGQMGAEFKITQLRIRPGKPFILAALPSGKYVFGLPGNPLSAFVCTVRLASRLLCRMAGGNPTDRGGRGQRTARVLSAGGLGKRRRSAAAVEGIGRHFHLGKGRCLDRSPRKRPGPGRRPDRAGVAAELNAAGGASRAEYHLSVMTIATTTAERRNVARKVKPPAVSTLRQSKIIPFGWYGGKFSHLAWLLPLLPQCHHYCEPFAGSAAVLLNRPPSPVETYNDLDGEVVNFFQLLRDQKDRLIEAIGLTPFSRQEFALACRLDPDVSPLERARRFYVRARQVRTGLAQTASLGRWANCKNTSRAGMSGVISRWLGGIEDLPLIAHRLLRVQIENRPALDVIRLYDSPETLFYCDPPYVHQTRGDSKAYKYEMADSGHVALARALNAARAMVAVSNYPCDLMDRLYPAPKWHKVVCAAKTNHATKGMRTEVLWTNYHPQSAPEKHDAHGHLFANP